MRPTTSRLLLVACVSACSSMFVGGIAVASPSGHGASIAARPVPSSALRQGRAARLSSYGPGRRGCPGCGFGLLPVGYGYGYGEFGYGYGSSGNDPFDPRRIRGDLPDDRNSAVPAVAGIPAPPVQPPAIYVIGDGEARGTPRVRSSSRAGADRAVGPRVARVR